MVRIVLVAVYVWPDYWIWNMHRWQKCGSFSPKFHVPNMHYWLKFADVSVAPNFECQICIISGLKFDWCLSAYIWVKPDCLIEELFYLMWGNGWCGADNVVVTSILLGQQKQYAVGFGHGSCSHSDSHCRLISCEWQFLCECSLELDVQQRYESSLLPWLHGCLVALLPTL